MAAPRKGLKALILKDADMVRAYKLAGAPALRKRAPGLPSLLRIIVNQQVSVHAGRAIWARLEAGLGRVSVETVLCASEADLRGFGLSAAKTRYAKALADAVSEGSLDLKGLERLSDDDVRGELTKVPGLGKWSADIYLMFALGRPDIWPVGDLALAVAVERLLGLKTRPGPREMDAIGEGWKPWRSAAAVMLWHFHKHALDGKSSR
jgi:DNA-3-methyladenine glycosylase II